MRVIALMISLTLSLAAAGAGPQYALKVKGLACPFCAYGIEKQLHKISGVEQVQVNLAKGHVRITMKEGSQLTRARAEQAVDKAGFTPGTFKPLPEEPNGRHE